MKYLMSKSEYEKVIIITNYKITLGTTYSIKIRVLFTFLVILIKGSITLLNQSKKYFNC